LPISVKSNPRRIFLYPLEVPQVVDRFSVWRDEKHARGELHPMILSIQLSTYILHIRPFLDGNGRVRRVLFAEYMIRPGYLPVVFSGLEREDYLTLISEA
jgi:Fic family protein